jgi:hypothetical protein
MEGNRQWPRCTSMCLTSVGPLWAAAWDPHPETTAPLAGTVRPVR